MKIAGIILLIFLVFLSVLFSFLVFRWDPNLFFRPALEKYLSETLGRKVVLGRTSLAWGFPPGLKIDGIEIHGSSNAVLLLKTGPVVARLDVAEFLMGRRRFQSLVLEQPELTLRRSLNGVWNWKPPRGKPPAAGRGVGAFSLTGALPGWSWQLETVTVKRGRIHFREESQNPPREIELSELEILAQRRDPASILQLEAFGELGQNKIWSPVVFRGHYESAKKEIALEASDAAGRVVLKGKLGFFPGGFRFSGGLGIHQLELGVTDLPVFRKARTHVSGILTGQGEGAIEAEFAELPEPVVVIADGAMDLRGGALKNINLLSAVLDQVALIPGFGRLTREPLPAGFAMVLKNQDTPFQMLRGKVRIRQERIFGEEIFLQNADYSLTGAGSLGIFEKDRDADFRAELVLPEPRSRALVEAVGEMKLFQNHEGRMVIPFLVRGLWPRPSVTLDLPALTAEVLQFQGEKMMNQFTAILEKKT